MLATIREQQAEIARLREVHDAARCFADSYMGNDLTSVVEFAAMQDALRLPS